ncbi:DUF6515 family protein [Alteromonas macleodii]|uniref:Lipoprotein n=1 Tax=Alteromonas macleodii TaxID=28108 RepID=A0A6T9Y0P8_ALTMA|nr:DUF6515 family protein [Alteromonas macleodii]CAB9494272.1 conserved exported protein of unknown function [Alteromonas macleodii]
MKLKIAMVSVLSVSLITACAHSPGGARGHVSVGGHGSGAVVAVTVRIGIGALITNVLTKPNYEPGHKPKDIPQNAHVIHYHGAAYRYHHGVFYREFDGHYHVVKPPIGITVKTLPPNPDVIIFEGDRYFTAEGVYYFQSGDEYVVVGEPILEKHEGEDQYLSGHLYSQLPNEAQTVEINGIQYFTYNGQFFLPQAVNGKIRYLVVEL